MSDKTWKKKERMIAREFFDTERNPLSGKNNRDDDGGRRSGDVVYKPALVEVKSRKKNACIGRAMETFKEAVEENKPFIHIEMLNGSNKVVGLFLPYNEAKELVREYLRKKWES